MQEHIVKGLLSPMRLDRYLRQRNYSLSQGVIEQSLRQGAIKVNGAKVKSSLRVNNDDIILYKQDLELNEGVIKQRLQFPQATISLAKKLLDDYLVFQDEKILVINKPGKLAVQGGTNISISVDDALQYLNSQGHDLRICHRLDRDTSGLLLIAKNRIVATQVMQGFKDHKLSKEYISVVGGRLSGENPIESYLSTSKNPAGERVQINHPKEVDDSKYALTEWKVLRNKGRVHLLSMHPKTGRMHQLRCHTLLISKGIIGDRKYFVDSLKQYDVNSLMLHAYKMQINKKVLGKAYKLVAPMPDSFISFLELHFGISSLPIL